MTARPTASAVILNWNGKNLLEVVLPSLRRQTFKDFETIVVDNGSKDGSVELVRKKYPWVRLVALEKNLGFAGGNNRGMEAARGEFVGLLNNDIEVDRDWVGEMVKALRSHPKAGSVACKMLQFDSRNRIDEVGGQGSWYGLFYPRGRGEKDVGQYNEAAPVLYASGGAVLYRQKMLKEVGLLDEDLFAYLEDVDLGLRAQLAGWSCLYEPKAIVYHMGGASFKKVSGLSQRMWARNWQTVVLKDYPLTALVRYTPKLIRAELKMLSGAVKDGWFGTYLRAQGGFLVRIPKTLFKRRKVQKLKRVDLRYLDTVMSKRLPSVKKPGKS